MSQEKVLIVEDEENERTGLAELVSSWGYDAETARDGQEGYEKVASWSPSIVITDLKMPRMGGLELLEKISGDSQSDRGHCGHCAGHHRQRGAGDAHRRLRLRHQADRYQPPAHHPAKRISPAGHPGRTRSHSPQAAGRGLSGIAGRPVEKDAGDLPADRNGRAQHGIGSDHRRERHRQRAGRAHHSRAQPAPVEARLSRSTARRFPKR